MVVITHMPVATIVLIAYSAWVPHYKTCPSLWPYRIVVIASGCLPEDQSSILCKVALPAIETFNPLVQFHTLLARCESTKCPAGQSVKPTALQAVVPSSTLGQDTNVELTT